VSRSERPGLEFRLERFHAADTPRFHQKRVNIPQAGADNLVLADANQEGANLLALQSRQSLSTTALSLTAQSDQAVLKLFR
jgi:flagellin